MKKKIATRFKDLYYSCEGPAQWSFYEKHENYYFASIGPKYKSRVELLADMRAFAEERGFEPA